MLVLEKLVQLVTEINVQFKQSHHAMSRPTCSQYRDNTHKTFSVSRSLVCYKCIDKLQEFTQWITKVTYKGHFKSMGTTWHDKACDFLSVFHSNCGLSWTVSEIQQELHLIISDFTSYMHFVHPSRATPSEFLQSYQEKLESCRY